MKMIYLLLIIILFDNSNRIDKIRIKIIDSKLIDSKLINVELINNSNLNYCFLIDTIYFERKQPNFNPSINQPKIILYDLKNQEVPILINLKDPYSKISNRNFRSIDKKFKNENTLIYLKSKSKIKLKIPFDLNINYQYYDEPAIYQINKKKKYFGRIEYMIQMEFFKKYISQDKLDSIKSKGFKIFTGKLKSNKIPLQ